MNTILSKMLVRGILVLALGSGLVAAAAYADERREHGRYGPYRSPHWVYDDRHHHGHYYPAVGYVVDAMPSGYMTLGFGSRRLYFQAGVWYEPVGRGFAVVRPPVGVVVPVLPPGYSAISAAGVPYYYANDIYYSAVPGGYAVANPPVGATYIEAPTAAPTAPPTVLAPPSPAVQSAAETWYYCDSAKAYYPYVSTCTEGWKPIPATPPPGR